MSKYPGHIEQHGEQWRITYSIHGRRHRVYLDGDTERADVEEAARKEYDRIRKEVGTEGDRTRAQVRFSALLKEFADHELPKLSAGTQRSYNDSLKPIREYFVDRGTDRRVDAIRRGSIRRYLQWRRKNRRNGDKPLSNRTLAKDRAVLHRMFDYAQELDYTDKNPVSHVKAPDSDDREWVILRRNEKGVSPEYEKLLTECRKSSPMLHLYTLILGECGVRCESEALHVQWRDIDLSGDPPAIWIAGRRGSHRSKSGKGRWVPISERLERELKAYMAKHRFDGTDSPYIFHHTHDRRQAKKGQRIRSMRRAFDNAADRAKLPDDFVRHDLRHTRCTWWIEDGIDISTVQLAMGHSDVKVTQKYTHLTRRSLRKMRQPEGERQKLAAMR